MKKNRYEQGWDKLKEVDGEAGERVIELKLIVDYLYTQSFNKVF